MCSLYVHNAQNFILVDALFLATRKIILGYERFILYTSTSMSTNEEREREREAKRRRQSQNNAMRMQVSRGKIARALLAERFCKFSHGLRTS